MYIIKRITHTQNRHLKVFLKANSLAEEFIRVLFASIFFILLVRLHSQNGQQKVYQRDIGMFSAQMPCKQ